MTADLLLHNARVVTADAEFAGGVLVRDGLIAQVTGPRETPPARRVIDLKGRVLMPGVVDSHVHLNDPGREHWETYADGTRAAAAGGVTTVLDMPLNSRPPTTSVAELERKREAAARSAVVDYGHWGGLIDNNLADVPALCEEGVIGLKGFMIDSEEYPRVDDALIWAGLNLAKAHDNLVGIHAENDSIISFLTRQLQEAGRTDLAAWPESRPPFQEVGAIESILYWAQVTGGRLHVVHASTAAGVEAVVRARRKGVKATVETCPHYLLFDLEDYLHIGPRAKVGPPLRSRGEVDELWEAVLLGQVDTIGSDHSPSGFPEKEIGQRDIWQAWGGISGLQTMLPALITAGVHRRRLPWPLMVRMLCANPARIFGLHPRKGVIQPGSDADLTVVDPDAVWTLRDEDLLYRNRHSAFTGYEFKGRVEATYLRGMPVFAGGEVVAEEGCGQLVRRESAAHEFP